jgi:hypothetical protein
MRAIIIWQHFLGGLYFLGSGFLETKLYGGGFWGAEIIWQWLLGGYSYLVGAFGGFSYMVAAFWGL